ncbi:ubiquitin-conjugating enzyme [Histoplasma capsulatum G186AR]|nr:ubiquitin-conjugating enzyme [Histoplasma capsulatum]QSS68025.1 ubiquitin-conjugating enzyme [Histoplasma capsulatum G186AR]
MASGFRRLALDHASLHRDGMPPHYLFPSANNASSPFPDDLTQLVVLLTGPQGTPYSQGLWRLHLRMPEDYPQSPPKAAFRTRIWHPNVDESTGAVCVDTLKKDWEPKLTLRDVLITISCLLIHPNPDSALNSAAGSLLQDDYDAFARQAELMTSIHAPIPKDMNDAVMEAKRRGDESGVIVPENKGRSAEAMITSRKTALTSSLSTVIMKKAVAHKNQTSQRIEKLDIRVKETSQNELLSSSSSQSSSTLSPFAQDRRPAHEDESDNEDTGGPSKENDPSLSPCPVVITTPSNSRKSVLGKRPLAVLESASEPELGPVDYSCDADVNVNAHSHSQDDDDDDGMTPSERNIAANAFASEQQQPLKSPKLSVLARGVNSSGRVRDDYPEHIISILEHNNSNKDSHDNGGKRVDRSSRQSSIFGLSQPLPSQLLLHLSNEKPSGGGKENDASTTTTSFIHPASTTIVTTTARHTSSTDKPEQPQPSGSASGSGTLAETIPLSGTHPPNNRKPAKAPQQPPSVPSSMSVSKSSTKNNSNSTTNKNRAAQKVSSAAAKAKATRVGLRRL